MRSLTRVLVVLTLVVAPVTAASAQVSNSPNPTVAVPSPPPDLSILNGRIPSPLPAPSQPPTIDGPTLQQGLNTAPAPVTPGAVPSVLQPTQVPSVFQSQTGL